MITQDEYFDFITERISIVKYEINTNGKLGKFNIHKATENFLIPLLEYTYGRKIRNLNDKDHPNYPAVDLGSEDKSIAYQVTSENEGSKIIKTLELAQRHDTYSSFERVVVFMLKDKKEGYDLKNPALEGIRFNPQDDVMDLNDLLKDIKNLRLHETEVIYDFVKRGLTYNNISSFIEEKIKTLIDIDQDSEMLGCPKYEHFSLTINLSNGDFPVFDIYEKFQDVFGRPSIYSETRNFFHVFYNDYQVNGGDHSAINYEMPIMRQGKIVSDRHTRLEIKDNLITYEHAQYKPQSQPIVTNLNEEVGPFLTLLFVVNRLYRSIPLDLKVRFEIKCNDELVYNQMSSIISPIAKFSSNTFSLKKVFILEKTINSIENNTLIKILKQIISGFVTSSTDWAFNPTSSPFIKIDENDQNIAIDTLKARFNPPLSEI